MVSKFQNAFVKERQILDASLVVNEAIDLTLKVDSNGVICKLDIEKAYGHVNWAFLLVVMKKKRVLTINGLDGFNSAFP